MDAGVEQEYGLTGKTKLHEIRTKENTNPSPPKNKQSQFCLKFNPDKVEFLNRWAKANGHDGFANFLRKISNDILIKNRVAYSRLIDDKYKHIKIEFDGICLDD